MRKFVFVGRVHPIKGLDRLLSSFSKAKQYGWKLKIVGPDQDGYTLKLKGLAKALEIEDSVEFVGPKFDNELWREYAEADCFILPSYSENFGSVVLEALAAGTPVITTKGTPWQELEMRGCGLWVGATVDEITEAMRIMMAKSDEERLQMGDNGRKLVAERYSWSAVCDKMEQSYKDIINERT